MCLSIECNNNYSDIDNPSQLWDTPIGSGWLEKIESLANTHAGVFYSFSHDLDFENIYMA